MQFALQPDYHFRTPLNSIQLNFNFRNRVPGVQSSNRESELWTVQKWQIASREMGLQKVCKKVCLSAHWLREEAITTRVRDKCPCSKWAASGIRIKFQSWPRKSDDIFVTEFNLIQFTDCVPILYEVQVMRDVSKNKLIWESDLFSFWSKS